jgi:O-antigen/teichoic acid export membrane protein
MVLDKTMMGILTNESQVGFYDSSQKIIRLTLAIVTSLGTVMLPKITNLYSNGDNEKIKQYLMNSFRFMTLISLPLIFGLIGISDNFVPLFFGKEYMEVIPLMKLASLMILVIAWGNVFGTQYILALGKMKEYTTSVVVGAIINFIMNLILIPRLLSLGAVVATLCTEIIIAGIQFYYSKSIVKKEWFLCGWRYWISSFIMFGLVYLVGNLLGSTVAGILVQVMSGALAYVIILFILKDDFIGVFLNKIKAFVNK